MPNSKKCYFVHIPKTAGNSVRKSLSSTGVLTNPGKVKSEREHHFGTDSALRAVGSHLSFTTDRFPSYLDKKEYLSANFSFTVLRNPFSLLLSYYSHYIDLSNTPKNWIDRGWANVNGHHKIKTFEEFIDAYTSMDSEKWHVPELSKNLFGQIFSKSGEISVDYAIFIESLSPGLREIVTMCNKDPSTIYLRNFNTSPRKPGGVSRFYNQDMIKKVQKKCEWELETFKYSFNKESQLGVKIVDLKSHIGDFYGS